MATVLLAVAFWLLSEEADEHRDGEMSAELERGDFGGKMEWYSALKLAANCWFSGELEDWAGGGELGACGGRGGGCCWCSGEVEEVVVTVGSD